MERLLRNIGEFGLIALLQRQFSKGKNVIQGIGDDAAVLPFYNKEYLLLTTDMMMEGVHFHPETLPEAIGHKAMACNISDIVAMGGTPTFAVVSLGLSANRRIEFVRRLYHGMHRISRLFGVAIVGGDTIKSRKLIVNIALLGKVKKNQLVTRAGAQKGDFIFVTGPLGGSLKSGYHLLFKPRFKESQYLVKNFKPSAMIDISDGLVADLGHILEESKVGAVLYEPLIPKNKGVSLQQALYEGEDFELNFTLPLSKARRLSQNRQFPFYFIGQIVDKREGLQLIRRDGNKTILTPKGFTHF